MARIVTVTLHNLHCIRESQDGSEPYIWPVLLWLDDTTLIQSPMNPIKEAVSPGLGNARVVLKSSMRAGDSAVIPYPLGNLGTPLEDGQNEMVLLVAQLNDKKDTPEAAMWAGCKAFSSELVSVLNEKRVELFLAYAEDRAGNPEPLKQLIKYIKERVRARVASATWDGLSDWDRLRAFTIAFDKGIGADFKVFSKPAGMSTFSLSLKTDNASDEYRLDGSVDAGPAGVDICQTYVDRVNAAQAVADKISSTINLLKKDLPPGSRGVSFYIKWLTQQLEVAVAELAEAREALQACRDLSKKTSEDVAAAEEVLG